MNRKNIFTALTCGLLILSLLGCGTSNNLQSIQLSTSNQSEVPMNALNLPGFGNTLQLYVWGNYSSGKHRLINTVGGAVAYQIVVTPGSSAVDPNTDALYPLSAPPSTVELSVNGLLTAVAPSACTWFDSAQPPATTPAWSMTGTYTVTATYGGFTSPPVFVAVASAPGFYSSHNLTGQCGPS